jgi:hypothetical protein
MNQADRKQVEDIVGKLTELAAARAKLVEQIETVNERIKDECGGALRDLADAEQEKFNNMSEGLQQGDNGQAIERAAEILSDAADSAEEEPEIEAGVNVDEIKNKLAELEGS